MSYLPRSERRTEVLEAVIRIAAEHGLEGATVRRISADLGISAGNIHHLFGSAAELKREAFRHFAEVEIAALDAAAEKPSAMEQLHAYLSSVAMATDQPMRRIWTSAGQEASRDDAFGALWAEKAEIWRNRIADLLVRISDGSASPEQALRSAWRLMGFAVGIGSFAGGRNSALDSDQINADIATLIGHELRELTKSETQTA